LIKNKKIKLYIRKKNHKPIILRFWIEDNINFLDNFDSGLII